MPSVPIYNQDGQQTGEMELAPEVFGVRPKMSVLHQAAVAYAANARIAIAHTKTRGEVRGGGKKPWAQKHTGRARAGSIRSPIWVGGGRVFGPRSTRNYSQKINIKMRRSALRMALSDKVSGGCLIIFEDFNPAGSRTKEAARWVATARAKASSGKRFPSVLVVLPPEKRSAALSIRNLKRVDGIDTAHLNVYSVLRHNILLTTRAGAELAAKLLAPKANR